MKRWIVLMGWMIMSFTAFSQTLKPTVLQVDNDTNFCFTIPQSKVLARYMIKGRYADTLEVKQLKTIDYYQLKVSTEIHKQEKLIGKIDNLNSIVINNDQTIELLKETIEQRDKKIKRSKWHKAILGGLSIISGVAVILK